MTHTADWYPDPSDQHQMRWFDGTTWTEHVAPATQQAQQPQVAAMPSGLASSTLLSSDNQEKLTTGRMTRQNPAVIKVTLGAEMMVTRGAMAAYQGQVAFAYTGQGMNRFLKASFSGEGLRLMRCEGQGEVFVAHRNRKLHLIELAPSEQISASARALLGFDASVGWNIEMIRGGVGAMAAGGLFNVTLTGPGTVILASDWPLVLNTSESRTLVDPNALVAWTANLPVKVRSSFSAGALIGRGSGEAFQLEFSPGGFVIVEPELSVRSSSGRKARIFAFLSEIPC